MMQVVARCGKNNDNDNDDDNGSSTGWRFFCLKMLSDVVTKNLYLWCMFLLLWLLSIFNNHHRIAAAAEWEEFIPFLFFRTHDYIGSYRNVEDSSISTTKIKLASVVVGRQEWNLRMHIFRITSSSKIIFLANLIIPVSYKSYYTVMILIHIK